MNSYRSRKWCEVEETRETKRREQEREFEFLKTMYEIAASKISSYQQQRYISIGFVVTLEIACITGFSYLMHTSTGSINSKLIAIVGYLLLPFLGEILLGGLWLNESRLKDYYSHSFEVCIKIEEKIGVETRLFSFLNKAPRNTIFGMEHTEYIRTVFSLLALFWVWAIAFGIVESYKVWYS